jgi:prepilin-type processing-associated H-X9-DG protein
MLICPSDGKTISADGTQALGDYMGINAPNTDQRDFWNINTQGVFVYQCHNTVNVSVNAPTAVVSTSGGATTLTNITDGTSNTFCVGERPPVPDGNPAPDPTLGGPQGTGGANASWCGGWTYVEIDSTMGIPNTKQWCAVVDQNGNNCPGGKQWFQQPLGKNNPCDGNHFWSRHTGGGNFLFCDGSVHFLSYGVSTTVQAALATKAGGEVIDASALGF